MRHAAPSRLPRVLALAGAALAVAASAALVTSTVASATTAPSGIVQRSGAQLTLDGSDYRFTGYQIGLGSSPAHPLCTSYPDSAVGPALVHAQQSSGANAVRVWMYQGYGGPSDWSRFDLIFSEARKAGVRVIATLTNQWGDCEPRRADGSLVVKRLGWYQSGYRAPDAGYALSFHDFVGAMATRYRDEPALLAWQLVNEAEPKKDDGSCDEQAGAAALRAFSDDLVGVVRAAGDPHLVGLGSMGSGQCGLSGSADFRYVHGGALDMCEYHDYTPVQAVPGDAWNGLATRVADCAAVGKPLFVGEAGIPAGIQADGSTGPVTAETLARRAALFDDKLTRQAAAGVAGFLVWQKATSNGDGFTVYDGDPVEAVLTRHAPPAGSVVGGGATAAPTASPTAGPTTTATPAPSPSPSSGTTTTTSTTVTTLTSLLSGITNLRGTGMLGLTTGTGRLVVTLRSTKASTVTVSVRDAAGTLLASARGSMPLALNASVKAGRQTVTVTGPPRLAFSLTASYPSA
jgi:hypothetical protein